jgi:hypothetical protein
MESSELTGLWSKQIGYGRRTVVQSTPKEIDFFPQVLGLGWVYLATEGIISLASLRRGPIPGGPLCDILVLDVRSVDLYQDVH